MMRNLVVGNWKMNGTISDLALVKKIAETAKIVTQKTETALCVPAVFIQNFASENLIHIGAQDCHHLNKGAHTGDIAADMLKNIGATHVIVGHSERRTDHHETNAQIHAKANAAFNAGIKPIICVGEAHEQYVAGTSQNIVIEQIINSVPITDHEFAIGYEPIWAIGTGLIPKLEEITDIHTVIRNTLTDMLGIEKANKVQILYGGSVKSNNAQEIAALNNVDGALVGGASLNADDFCAIMNAFSE
ncbi:MAG: triosephosphate isomerase [Alphaproteobacteria bacterium]|jgi:triosephosphate isomerase